MDNNTQKLLEQLAEKLGTTTEYLWGVLVRQAPIDATISLFQTVVVILFGYVLYKLHRKFLGNVDDEDRYHNNYYDRYDIAVSIPMIGGAIIFIVLAVMALLCVGDIVNGYFNPEYWALNRVLQLVLK